MKAAGLAETRKYALSDEELFTNIEKVWIYLGRQPKRDEMNDRENTPSVISSTTYEKRFGSWRGALEEFIQYINSGSSEDCETDDSVENTIDEESKIKHKTKREISDRLRFSILMRDGFTCQSCGASPTKERGVELHVDHIIPWSKGGETEEKNLQTKCKRCNLGKGNAFDQ